MLGKLEHRQQSFQHTVMARLLINAHKSQPIQPRSAHTIQEYPDAKYQEGDGKPESG